MEAINTTQDFKEVVDAKQRVLKIAKKAYKDQLVAGTSGNFSIFLKKFNQVIITPSSIDYTEMQEEDIVVIDLDGNVIEGVHKPSSEWPMHTEIYKTFDSDSSLVHTHSPYATAFAVCGEGIPEILIEMKPFIGGDVKVAPFAPAGTTELGQVTVPYLIDRKACLLANHGTMSIGKSIEDAYLANIYLEDVAKIYHFAKGVGQPNILN